MLYRQTYTRQRMAQPQETRANSVCQTFGTVRSHGIVRKWSDHWQTRMDVGVWQSQGISVALLFALLGR